MGIAFFRLYLCYQFRSIAQRVELYGNQLEFNFFLFKLKIIGTHRIHFPINFTLLLDQLKLSLITPRRKDRYIFSCNIVFRFPLHVPRRGIGAFFRSATDPNTRRYGVLDNRSGSFSFGDVSSRSSDALTRHFVSDTY